MAIKKEKIVDTCFGKKKPVGVVTAFDESTGYAVVIPSATKKAGPKGPATSKEFSELKR